MWYRLSQWWFNGLTFGPRSMMFRNRDEQWRVQTVCLVGRKGRANRGKTHYLFEDLCFGKCVNRECGLKKWWTIGRRVWCATYAGRQMDRRFALHTRTGMLYSEMWMAIGCGGKIWRCSSAFVNGPQIADSSSSALFRLSNRLSSRLCTYHLAGLYHY